MIYELANHTLYLQQPWQRGSQACNKATKLIIILHVLYLHIGNTCCNMCKHNISYEIM